MQFSLTVLQAIVFANTENSFAASLKLLDQDQFKDQITITEYPILTALARNTKPSEALLNNLKNYLLSKNADNPYLRKLYLVFSSLVKTHCQNHECNETELDGYSSLFAANLGSNCADSQKKNLVVASLKSIGNIGFFKKADVINACLINKDNSLEVRLSAIEAFRRFSCDSLKEKAGNLLGTIANQEEDTELRINAFQVAVRCVNHADFQEILKDRFPSLLETETNIQV